MVDVTVTGQVLDAFIGVPSPTANTVDNISVNLQSSTPIPKVKEVLPTAGIIGPDLRKELKLLVDNVGFRWVGLRSVDHSTRCDCKSEYPGFNIASCTRCMGTGFVFTDYLVKAYSWMGVFGVQFESEIGRISTQGKNCVLEHDRPVNKRDYILELDLDNNTGRPIMPFRVLKYFEVQDSSAMLGDGARVEFWRCTLEERSIYINSDSDGRDRPTQVSNTGQP